VLTLTTVYIDRDRRDDRASDPSLSVIDARAWLRSTMLLLAAFAMLFFSLSRLGVEGLDNGVAPLPCVYTVASRRIRFYLSFLSTAALLDSAVRNAFPEEVHSGGVAGTRSGDITMRPQSVLRRITWLHPACATLAT